LAVRPEAWQVVDAIHRHLPPSLNAAPVWESQPGTAPRCQKFSDRLIMMPAAARVPHEWRESPCGFESRVAPRSIGGASGDQLGV
jgi:hypothetical protein